MAPQTTKNPSEILATMQRLKAELEQLTNTAFEVQRDTYHFMNMQKIKSSFVGRADVSANLRSYTIWQELTRMQYDVASLISTMKFLEMQCRPIMKEEERRMRYVS